MMFIDNYLKKIDAANTENFVKLVEISGLDPKLDFRFANFEGMDFSGCSLKGFDFTGSDFTRARLGNANFDGAIIRGAVFSKIENPRRNDNKNITTKRQQIIRAMSSWLGTDLKAVSRTWFENSDSTTRVVCTISKGFDSGTPYWFAYHPKWDDFLKEALKAYFILGCLDLDSAFAIPRSVIAKALPDLHASQDNGRKYWHIHVRRNISKGYELAVPNKINVSLDQFRVSL
ncbi:pentapeptide repeat-containing protein [Mesorhizobium comanense]|uniref:pentapeptide repeat-containing protein n=1 Tax=Mesorhizobium comanense TaxID=2502215 RepID=UPI0010F4E9EE|nr:pentapeptide repeat-containing protein [Mesorhizobium comanense]